MLASFRIEGDVYSIPRFDIERTDIEGFINELKVFHGKFRDCFYRVETKEKAFQLHGRTVQSALRKRT